MTAHCGIAPHPWINRLIVTVIALTLFLPTVKAGASMIDLTSSLQGDGNKGFSFRPVANDGVTPAPFLMSARSLVNYLDPFNPEASGSAGTVYIDLAGAGVQTGNKEGSKGISGGGGHKDEELIFTFDTSVFLNSIVLKINEIDFGTGLRDKDDPIIFLSLAGSNSFGYTIYESEIFSAFSSTGNKAGLVTFGLFSSLSGNTAIDSFKIRETNDHIFVSGVGASPVPIPPAIWLLGTGLVGLIGLKRRIE